jgi:predicted RNA-binding protein
MCESNVYLAEGDDEALLMEDVGWLEIDGATILLKDITGAEKTLEGRIVYIDFVQHHIVIEPAGSGRALA